MKKITALELSALIDGELGAEDKEKALAALKADKELQKTWECYHRIRTVFQKKSKMYLKPCASKGHEFDEKIVSNNHAPSIQVQDDRKSG